LRAQEYQELKEIAELAFSRQGTVKEMFKWAKLRAAFESISPGEIKGPLPIEGKLERIGSIHVESSKASSLEPFNIDKIKNNLREAPLDRKLEEEDIDRITHLVLDDIILAGRDVLKREEIQAKMLRYLKAQGLTIRTPEYYERIAPLALRTLHKSDINALSPDEYAAYLQLASTFIMKRPSPPSSSGMVESARSVGLPVTLTAAKDSRIIGHIQFIGPAPALEELKSSLRKDLGIEVAPPKDAQSKALPGAKDAPPKGRILQSETSV
jgi:hypothetical protein